MPQKSSHSSITQNATWLMALQISSYIVPFLLLPYLARTLGAEAFGELAVGWAVVAYLAIFVDFGFYLWGVRESALHRHDPQRISRLWVSIQGIKISLLFISLLFMLAASKIAGSSVYLYLFLWFALTGQALMPGWLYQGMEKSFWFLVFSILAQVVAAVATVVFVSSVSELLFVPLCAGLSWMLFSALANIDVCKRFNIGFILPDRAFVSETLKGAWPLFSANIWVAFYINLPALAVGFLSDRSEAGQFVGAQKIILAIQALFTPISSALFPHASRIASKDKKEAFLFLKKAGLISVSAMFAMSLFVFLLADFIGVLALGSHFEKSGKLLRIMAFGPVFVVGSMLLSNHCIVALGKASILRRLYMITAAVSVVLSVLLVGAFDSVGAAFVYLFTEAFVFALLLRTALKISSN